MLIVASAMCFVVKKKNKKKEEEDAEGGGEKKGKKKGKVHLSSLETTSLLVLSCGWLVEWLHCRVTIRIPPRRTGAHCCGTLKAILFCPLIGLF